MVKVAILYADASGCGIYRCALPANAVQPLGVNARLESQLLAKVVDGKVVHVPKVAADVLVYQRPLAKRLVDTIPFVKAQGVRVVVEIDDDLEATSPRNPAYAAVHPRRSIESNWHHLRRAIDMADMVTVSTDALASKYGPKAVVVPNFVPEQMLAVKRPRMEATDGSGLDDLVRIGWAGQQAYHPLDLQETCGAVAEVMEATGAAFRVIGDPQGVPQALGLTRGTFEATGWVPIGQYAMALSTIDVGIVPLEDSPFNRAKSWLKGLEMAALGVPFIASPLPEYVKLHQHGIGLLARNRTEWHDQLTRLVQDADYRRELADQGRRAVHDVPLTMEGNGHRWAAAWTSVTKKLILVNGGTHAAASTA